MLCRMHVAIHVVSLLSELGIAAATLVTCIQRSQGLRGNSASSEFLFLALSLLATLFNCTLNAVGAAVVWSWLKRVAKFIKNPDGEDMPMAYMRTFDMGAPSFTRATLPQTSCTASHQSNNSHSTGMAHMLSVLTLARFRRPSSVVPVTTSRGNSEQAMRAVGFGTRSTAQGAVMHTRSLPAILLLPCSAKRERTYSDPQLAANAGK